MPPDTTTIHTVVVVIVTVIGLTAGVGGVVDIVAAQPSGSIPSANSIATGATTTQSFNFDVQIPQGGISASCTVDVSQLTNQQVTLTSVDISNVGDATLSASLDGSSLTISISDSDADAESGTATVTVTADTKGSLPSQGLSHQVDSCGASTLSAQSVAAAVQQASTFNLEDTGIQDSTNTTVHSTDSTIQNDSTLAQSIDLDLIVPDDTGDTDTFNITIDTSQARANGINITDAVVENDPSGANASIEVVSSPTVTASENVTLTIQEAAADRDDGDISQEVITLEVTLDSTQHAAGAFTATPDIKHVINDDVGSTAANVSFNSSDTGTEQPTVIGDTPATDPDGDGLYQDVNGDKTVDARDVLALWNNRNTVSADFFSFDGNDVVDARDVLRLWNDYVAS